MYPATCTAAIPFSTLRTTPAGVALAGQAFTVPFPERATAAPGVSVVVSVVSTWKVATCSATPSYDTFIHSSPFSLRP